MPNKKIYTPTRSSRDKLRSTELIHHPYQPPTEFASPAPPVYKGSTIFFPDMAAVRSRDWTNKSGYTYGLHGTPTSFLLEERIATLEAAHYCCLAPSGLAANTTVNLALLEQGDEVLMPDNIYGPNHAFAQNMLSKMGIRCTTYDPLDTQDLANKLNEKSKLVWLEAPGSITMEFPDLYRLVEICKTHGVITVLDNTWGAGLAFNPFSFNTNDNADDFGVDISVHALTKYPSGGGDILMGSICTRKHDLHRAISRCHMFLGLGVGMNDVETILRNLPSISLRYTAQDTAARHLARFIQKQPQVTQILHPALPESLGHENWLKLCTTDNNPEHGLAAGIFSFFPDASWGSSEIDTFCNALKLFRIGYSWGGPTSLVMAYDLKYDRPNHLPSSQQRLAGRRIIRLCIGLEDVHDLQNDLAQAFAQVKI